jgi:hypothetical protein
VLDDYLGFWPTLKEVVAIKTKLKPCFQASMQRTYWECETARSSGSASKSFARTEAALGVDLGGDFPQGKRSWFYLHKRGGKHDKLVAHIKAARHVALQMTKRRAPWAGKNADLLAQLPG